MLGSWLKTCSARLLSTRESWAWRSTKGALTGSCPTLELGSGLAGELNSLRHPPAWHLLVWTLNVQRHFGGQQAKPAVMRISAEPVILRRA